jgi:hypothetical protein
MYPSFVHDFPNTLYQWNNCHDILHFRRKEQFIESLYTSELHCRGTLDLTGLHNTQRAQRRLHRAHFDINHVSDDGAALRLYQPLWLSLLQSPFFQQISVKTRQEKIMDRDYEYITRN